MKLYLHIGTEKTGSSFLQSLIHNNKALFKEEYKIYIPKNLEQDRRMDRGIISGGNGLELYKILESTNYVKLNAYLKEIKENATAKNCNSILLSNENLFRVLGENLECFIEACNYLKIQVHFCLFLREPVSHIISMYKHRNKTGKYKDINEWLVDYTTIRDLNSFINSITLKAVYNNLSVYCYDSTKPLEKNFFDNFLNIPSSTLQQKFKKVNTSLTFSEIEVLQYLYSKNALFAGQLSAFFEKLNKSDKASDNIKLIEYYEYKALKYVLENYHSFHKVYTKFSIIVKSRDDLVAKEQQLKKSLEPFNKIDLSLSRAQLDLIVKTSSLKNKLKLFIIFLRRKFIAPLVPSHLKKYIKYYRL